MTTFNKIILAIFGVCLTVAYNIDFYYIKDILFLVSIILIINLIFEVKKQVIITCNFDEFKQMRDFGHCTLFKISDISDSRYITKSIYKERFGYDAHEEYYEETNYRKIKNKYNVFFLIEPQNIGIK